MLYSTLSKETWTKKHCTKLLLNKGADINSYGRNKDTPLQKPIKGDMKALHNFYWIKKTDTSPCNENKETPLHKACERGHESFVILLFDHGADINFLTIRNRLLYI